jgi:ribonuclease-3
MESSKPLDPQGLCDRLGVQIPHELLLESLTHRSFAYERGGLRPNERLEFLGDSVVGLVVTDALFRRNEDLPEGNLAKMRSSVVSSKALAEVAREIDLGSYLLLGKGEEATGGRDKSSILADAVEAVIGAVYLGCGLESVTAVIYRLVDPVIEQAKNLGAGLDWKTSLQELTSSLGLGVPEYVIEGTGPDHERKFTARVRLSDGLHGFGEGATKKEAEQNAARGAYSELSESESEWEAEGESTETESQPEPVAKTGA